VISGARDKEFFWVFWVVSSIYRSNDGQSSEGYVEVKVSRFAKLVLLKGCKKCKEIKTTTEGAVDFSKECD